MGGGLRADELQDLFGSAAKVTRGGRDVRRSDQSQQADRDIAEAGQRPRAVSFADLAPVFVVGHVAHMVEAVFDVPVFTVELQEARSRRLLVVCTRDPEANLGR